MTDGMKKSWDEIIQADQRFWVALQALLVGARAERLEILRSGLTTALDSALRVLGHVGSDEVEELLPELLHLAGGVHRHLWQVRALIRNLPKDRLVARIERLAEPILASGDAQEYYRFLELYAQIDYGLTERLAKRAASSADHDIREAGQSFLEKLREHK
ncbi:MAG TPA: hypothetical protein VIX91_20620 [Candidatus Acidoferrum sp.]